MDLLRFFSAKGKYSSFISIGAFAAVSAHSRKSSFRKPTEGGPEAGLGHASALRTDHNHRVAAHLRDVKGSVPGIVVLRLGKGITRACSPPKIFRINSSQIRLKIPPMCLDSIN